MNTGPLNAFERAVLARFVHGDERVLRLLADQIAAATVRGRETHPSGQLTDLWVPAECEVVRHEDRFALDDVFGRVTGLGEEVCFLLHVNRGRAATLEAFVASGDWPPTPALEECWYVAPDPEQAGMLARVDARATGFALRALRSAAKT